ncbi:MAG: disulfide bond formation protein B [Aliishimia sp.]
MSNPPMDRNPTSRNLMLVAASGSLTLMIGAYLFQHVGGMAPCKLCITQRYPHVIAIALGVIAYFIPHRVIAALGAVAAATTSGYGMYHTGVERGWWQGPTSCTSGPIGEQSADDLFNQIMAAPLVRCDDVPWDLFTLSMASWNALISLGLVVIWIAAFKRASV